MPAKATSRVDAGLQPRQPVEQEVDLELRARRLGLGVLALAEQDPQHPGRDVGQHVPGGDGVLAVAVVPDDLGAVVDRA